MARAALKALSRKSLSVDELFETLDALTDMPAQAEVLIGYSLLEDQLKQAILRRLPTPLSNTDIANLFENEGPMASIGARAIIAYALGIIGTDTRADLNCIKEIRNAFAHARVTVSFDTPEIAAACRDLTAPHRLRGMERLRKADGSPEWPPTDTRQLFRSTIRLSWMHIGQLGAGGQPVLEPP